MPLKMEYFDFRPLAELNKICEYTIKKARHPVGLFRIGGLGITPVVPHVLVLHLSLLFYVADSSSKCNSIKSSHNFTRCIPT